MIDARPEQPGDGEGPRRRAFGATRTGLPDTSPTWELELLLSGAVLVALFQLSGVMDRVFDRFAPHITRATALPLVFGYWYGKAMVLALISTFVLHLASRGYWVGLVGLHSVFPNGVRWEELKYGPTTREIMRERTPSLPPIIARLDNFCSALFSFGFLLVLGFGVSLLTAAVVGAAAYAVAFALFGGRRLLTVFYVIVAPLALFPALWTIVDRRFGSRFGASSGRGRALRRVARAYYWVTGFPIYGPILLTLVSNTRRRLFTGVFYAATVAILAIVTANVFARMRALDVNSYAYFAQPDRFSVNAIYYESQRPRADALPRVPTIQSDVIREPFVKLFIPYAPERHGRLIERSCPGARPLRRVGVHLSDPRDEAVPDSAALAVLRCFARFHPVTLNGAPVDTLELLFHVHPGNSLRGVITYIPTAGLPRGRNVLTVGRAPPAGDSRQTEPLGPHVIPFWL